MTARDDLRIIDALARGIDPDTGEHIPGKEALLNRPGVIRALFAASAAMSGAPHIPSIAGGETAARGTDRLAGYPDGYLLDTSELGTRLRMSASTVYRLNSTSPEKLPPGFQIGLRWFWRNGDVTRWLDGLARGARGAPDARAGIPPAPRRRGRPTNAEQIARGKIVPAATPAPRPAHEFREWKYRGR